MLLLGTFGVVESVEALEIKVVLVGMGAHWSFVGSETQRQLRRS